MLDALWLIVSKAFDTVDHIVLVKKLQVLGLPANILIGLFLC